MKLCWFHLMPYTDLPEDFPESHPSVWVDIDSRLFDAERAHAMYNDFLDELEHAARAVLPFLTGSSRTEDNPSARA